MLKLSKIRVLKISTIGLLLLASGFVVTFILDINPLARAKPEDRSLDELIDDMDVELLPFSKTQVEVRLQDLNGDDVDISDFRGSIVFLNFWATWCATCVFEMPAMERLHRKMANEKFTIVAVSIQEPAADVKRFVNRYKLTFPALLDLNGITVPGFSIREIPTTVILDKAGRIVGRMTGPREWDGRESVAMFKRLAGGQSTN
jgi:thiol-disulfide isomerase/thioredoxin